MPTPSRPHCASDRLFRVSLGDTLAWVVSPVVAGPLWQAPITEDPEAWLVEQVFGRVLDENEPRPRVQATTLGVLWAWQPHRPCHVVLNDGTRLRWAEHEGSLHLQRQEGLSWSLCQVNDWDRALSDLPQVLNTPVSTSRVLVSDAWMHCFVGSRETLVRWAYDPRTDHLVSQANNGGHWEPLHPEEQADLRAELVDNEVLTSPFEQEDVTLSQKWPIWAGERPSPAPLRRRPAP
jgi:hypothetical protein